MRPFARRLAEAGMRNGLARTVLKLTVPGVPDTYQGTAFWDLSLVDPDNRRPVDYAGAAAALEAGGSPTELIALWPDGRVKQSVTAALLADRAACPTLYAEGDYQPLPASGAAAPHVLAFARMAGGEELVAAVTRLGAAGPDWAGTRLALPAGVWRNLLDDRPVEADQTGVAAEELFARLPVAVLRRSA
jgi:(1->4)-alpha-D-glucan 1-alpha-D-glucosylmutase